MKFIYGVGMISACMYMNAVAADHTVKNRRLSVPQEMDVRSNQKYLEQCAQHGRTKPNTAVDPKNAERAKLYSDVQAILAQPEYRCTKCHSNGKSEGSKNFSNILDRDELIKKGIINLEKPENSSLHRELKDNSMPLEGKKVKEEEKKKILEWIKSGAPNAQGIGANELPMGFVSENDKYLCIEKDLRRVPVNERTTTRYLDLTHLYNSGRRTDEVEVAINRLINSLSFNKRLKLATRVDEAGTLLRINLRDFWSHDVWEQILKKNPYGIELNTSTAKGVYSKTGSTVPDIRGDWFVAAASKEPLYSKILGFSDHLNESEFLRRVGADFKSALVASERFSVGNRKSGVSNNNRAFQRIPTVDPDITNGQDPRFLVGYVYKSDDFKSSDGKQNIFSHPGDYERNGGEYIASVPKEDEHGRKMNAQIYGLFNEKGAAVPDVDVNLGIVSHVNRPRHAFRVANGVSCFDCHERLGSGIINPKRNEMAEHLAKNKDLFHEGAENSSLFDDYLPQEKIEPIYRRDQALYKIFEEATGGRPGVVFNVANGFEDEMSERQVAAELGLKLEDFRHKVKDNPELKKRLAFESTGFVSRQTFLEEFKHAKHLLEGKSTEINSNDLDLKFVKISAGEFLMGSDSKDDSESEESESLHRVEITRPFEIGKFEVTQHLWEKVMGTNPAEFKGTFRPVENVSWIDITKEGGFLDRLNKLRDRQGDPCTYRLPTEAEWEFAARAGTNTKYSFGNSKRHLERFGWFVENSEGRTHYVDEAGVEANPHGLHGIHGNVKEWCQDSFKFNLGSELRVDPKIGSDENDSTLRMVRGGGWGDAAAKLRSAKREGLLPTFSASDLGFRLVRTCPVPETKSNKKY